MALSSVLMISTGCQSTDRNAVIEAAAKKAAAEVRVALPPLPDACRENMDRVIPKPGEKWRWVQKRWEIAADQSDSRKDGCAAFYDNVKEGFTK